MGQVYTVEFNNQVITSAGGTREFFYIEPADDRPLKILALFLSQFSDLQDANEEILQILFVRGHATASSGGATATPRPVHRRSGAAAFVARVNDTTLASTGTPVNLHADGFNIRVPQPLILPEAMQWDCDQADGSIVVRLNAAVADDLTMSATLYVEED